MADAVTNKTIINTSDRLEIHLTNISDGTGETNVIKVDKSTFTAPDGAEPASVDIEWVRWSVQGFASVRLLWDHTTDDLGLVLAASGYDDYAGPAVQGFVPLRLNADPRSAGGTGDVLLTTNGGGSGSTYDITISFIKQSN